MAEYFNNNGWYDRCLEQCDENIQNFPDDRESYPEIILLKSMMLAKLSRWKEAYDNLETYYQQHITDQTLIMGTPFNLNIYVATELQKRDILLMEEKYLEAADIDMLLIKTLRSPRDDAWKTYIAASPSFANWNVHVIFPEHAAYMYFLAGNYDTACAMYNKILTDCMNYPSATDLINYIQAKFGLKQYYIIPVEIATCQMQAKNYNDALKTYEGIQRNLLDPLFHRKYFSLRFELMPSGLLVMMMLQLLIIQMLICR